MSYIFEKTLILSEQKEDEKISKKEKSTEIFEESFCQKFRLKNIDERRNYFLKEIEQNKLMSGRNKKISTALNYIGHVLVLVSIIIGCISISGFASLLGLLVGITSSTIGWKVFLITTGIKKYNSTIKKYKMKHSKTVLTPKSKLNSLELLISKTLIDPDISHDEFSLTNNALKENDDIKEKITFLRMWTVYRRF